MKKVFGLFILCILPSVVDAEYIRKTGDGVYEFYVDDCSIDSMKQALDWATVAQRAMITTVKCEYKPHFDYSVITLVDEYILYEKKYTIINQKQLIK
ncbi:MAG: hypothetical protein MJ187_00955 [Alphaproteobacteria bacterium]|nr:hypothetical protein [Alphaproteobacteria bacterium]